MPLHCIDDPLGRDMLTETQLGLCDRCELTLVTMEYGKVWQGIGEIHPSALDVFLSARQSKCLICIQVIKAAPMDRRARLCLFGDESNTYDSLPPMDLNGNDLLPWNEAESLQSISFEKLDHSIDFTLEIKPSSTTSFDIELNLYPHRELEGWTETITIHANQWQQADYLALTASQEDNLGPATLGLCKYWLNRCLNEHICQETQTDWYPSRLLQVEGHQVRLIISSTAKPLTPYATLSHCWGTTTFDVLNASTLEAYSRGVSTRDLPSNFRDAIHIVSSLGLQYIWIDSLCILQGDTADWDKESQLMHLVYANAILNIGATRATTPFCGLSLEPRTQPYARWKDLKLWTYERASFEASNSPTGPLMKRGWVVQERFLCQRMIHFAQNGLWWECAQLQRVSERCPDRVGLNDTQQSHIGPGTVTSTKVETFLAWSTFIKQYTEAALTFPDKDKYRAADGYISRLEIETLYGHPILLQSLLWAVEPRSSTIRSARQVPSWSWVSMDGPLDVKPMQATQAGLRPLGVAFCEGRTMCCLGRLLHARPRDSGVEIIGCGVVYARFDGQQRPSSCFLLPVWPPSCPLNAGSEPFALILEAEHDGTFRRVGVANSHEPDPDSDELHSGINPLILDAYRRAKARLIILR